MPDAYASLLVDLSMQEPSSIKKGLSNGLWKESMHYEFNALVKKNTWTLVPPSKNRKIIGNMCIFKVGKLTNGPFVKESYV